MNEAAYHAILKRLGVAPPAPQPDRALVAQLLGMSLDRFEREGHPLEVRTPWLEKTFWFVPTGADAEPLEREGVSRGRVWTARELMDLLSIPGLTRAQAHTVAQAKMAFASEIVEVRPRALEEKRE